MSKEVAVRSKVELDGVEGLLAEHRRCLDSIKQWEERRDALAAKIEEIMGDAEVGTVEGREVVTYARTDRFQGSRFKKDHPDLYEVYTDLVEVPQLNVKSIKLARPELYEQYQSRSLRNTYTD